LLWKKCHKERHIHGEQNPQYTTRNDTTSLAGCIMSLLENKEARSRMGRIGQERFTLELNRESQVPKREEAGIKVGASLTISQTVTIIVITYNSARHITACLESIVPQLPNPGSKVVVFDNASADGTAEIVAASWPSVDLTRSASNLGFGRACNQVAKELATDFILLINPDAVISAGCVDALLDLAIRVPEAGLYGGRGYTSNGMLDPKSCFGRPSLWGLFCFATGLSSVLSRSQWFNTDNIGNWARDSERQVGVITGFLLLVDRLVWERLAGFDDKFFIYGEDFDLSMRAADIGCRPMITPGAGVVHVGGGSSSPADRLVLLFRGKITLTRKLWTGPKRVSAELMLMTGVWLRAVLSDVRDRSKTHSRSPTQTPPKAWAVLWRTRNQWRNGW
jgi:N-acetylglucosaminyl-diphospho-decaprenol L-rhamnosyltransferase